MIFKLAPSRRLVKCRLIRQLSMIYCLIIIGLFLVCTHLVAATLFPKSRICFNSMVSSFQSECVYCDTRLYTSTLIACTGSPALANNITQAQAFCIATACLQVPVSNDYFANKRQWLSPASRPFSVLRQRWTAANDLLLRSAAAIRWKVLVKNLDKMRMIKRFGEHFSLKRAHYARPLLHKDTAHFMHQPESQALLSAQHRLKLSGNYEEAVPVQSSSVYNDQMEHVDDLVMRLSSVVDKHNNKYS